MNDYDISSMDRHEYRNFLDTGEHFVLFFKVDINRIYTLPFQQKHSNRTMHKIQYIDNHYRTANRPLSPLSKLFPSALFYANLFFIIYRASKLAQKGHYDGSSWADSSFEVMQKLEDAGVCIDISGIENIEKQAGAVVIVGNHMSMMETLLLPTIIQSIKPVTFVVKEALLSYPIFKHIMRARNPIAVTRTNPRQDLKAVMNGGLERLQKDVSIIVFPQTTRSHVFDSKQMSSIGVKLAKKAAVPIVPLALKTDCWQNGKSFKDFGRLDLRKRAYFSFGEAITVVGKGDAEQATINAFIDRKIKEWEELV